MNDILKALDSINNWNTKPMITPGFIRKAYLNKITKSLNNKLIKVIVGQRRAGKSYIIRQIINYLMEEKSVDPRSIFYLNKEMYEFESINTAAKLDEIVRLYEKEVTPEGKVYLFIDEVQNIADWEKIIVSFAQHPVKDYEVFITGSNATLLSGELASFLSGRYIVFEVFPFSYSEFLGYHSYENQKQNFIKYFETSGLPEIYNIESDEIRKHYFQSLKDTIFLKDIMYRHKIRDYILLEDLFLFLLHNVGNQTSVPAIIKYFKSRNRKTDYSTLSAYLSYMEEAFIVRQSPRYFIKTKELLSGEKKYFINDLGFRNYLFPRLKKDIAAILENIVFLHLRNAGYTVSTGYGNNFEVDFVATRNEFTIYVQVAYLLASEKTIQREFGAFEKINDHFPKYVVTMDDLLIKYSKGIIHENIWSFINNLTNL